MEQSILLFASHAKMPYLSHIQTEIGPGIREIGNQLQKYCYNWEKALCIGNPKEALCDSFEIGRRVYGIIQNMQASSLNAATDCRL